MFQILWKPGVTYATFLAVAVSASSAVAQDCAQRIAQVQASADRMSSNPRKNSAVNQLENARKELAAGDEKRCLLYVRSAQNSLDERRRNKNN